MWRACITHINKTIGVKKGDSFKHLIDVFDHVMRLLYADC